MLCTSMMGDEGDEVMAKFNGITSLIWMVLASKQPLILPVFMCNLFMCNDDKNFLALFLQTAYI